jgi:hypothetical protein
LNSTEYISAVIDTGTDTDEIGTTAALEILQALVMVLNGSGNDDRHLPGMEELHRKVMQRYGWVMNLEGPQRW